MWDIVGCSWYFTLSFNKIQKKVKSSILSSSPLRVFYILIQSYYHADRGLCNLYIRKVLSLEVCVQIFNFWEVYGMWKLFISLNFASYIQIMNFWSQWNWCQLCWKNYYFKFCLIHQSSPVILIFLKIKTVK